MAGSAAPATPQLQVLYNFSRLNGTAPSASMIMDAAGNLYGTTKEGGQSNFGVVFELTPPLAGQTAWAETVLTSFASKGGAYGFNPVASLLADKVGNLYGTTAYGGVRTQQTCPNAGCGVVFELSPPVKGQTAWTDRVIFAFNDTDGMLPLAGLVADGAGNLYGTTGFGGATEAGVVFELSPPLAGHTAWTETILYSFNGRHDGIEPAATVVADAAGNLYGTTIEGGVKNEGVVFEVSPPAAGQTTWTEKVLHSFDGANGSYPQDPLILDGAGNLYGTTESGGANNYGTVFELKPPLSGKTAWIEKLLLSFNYTDGDAPDAGLIADRAGNLYGATVAGGENENGVVFELSPPLQGQTSWSETVLASFVGAGGGAQGGLVADGAGNLYGTTYEGGTHRAGLIFQLAH